MRCQQVISILCAQAAALSGFAILTTEAQSIGQETPDDATESCKYDPVVIICLGTPAHMLT